MWLILLCGVEEWLSLLCEGVPLREPFDDEALVASLYKGVGVVKRSSSLTSIYISEETLVLLYMNIEYLKSHKFCV